MKHTPGPWKADPKRLVIDTGRGKVEGPIMSYLVGNKASAQGSVVSIASERHADHYLCAAAPELLEALQKCAQVIADEYGGWTDAELENAEPPTARYIYRQARAAIAKALGK